MSLYFFNSFRMSVLHGQNFRTMPLCFLSRRRDAIIFCAGQHNRSYCSSPAKKQINMLTHFKSKGVKPLTFRSIFRGLIVKALFRFQEFNLDKEFGKGVLQAVWKTSQFISEGNFDALQGSVTPDVIAEIHKHYQDLNPSSQKEICMRIVNHKFTIYDKNILVESDEKNGKKKRIYLQISTLTCEESTYGPGCKLSGEPIPREHTRVYDYRFIREITNGMESDWIIDRINHFKAIDDMTKCNSKR